MSKKHDQVERTRNVVCSGGPRDGCWYTEAFWTQAVRSALQDGETPHAGRTLGYLITKGEPEVNRSLPHVSGRVARWNPGRAVELLAKATENGTHPNPGGAP